jgi:transposase
MDRRRDGGHRAAAVYSLIKTCKKNDVPTPWLADVLARLPDHAGRVTELLPWNRKANQ